MNRTHLLHSLLATVFVGVAVTLLAPACLAPGADTRRTDRGTPPDRVGGSGGTGHGGTGAACNGTGVPKPPPGWSGPFLLRMDPPGKAPACPESAPPTVPM